MSIFTGWICAKNLTFFTFDLPYGQQQHYENKLQHPIFAVNKSLTPFLFPFVHFHLSLSARASDRA
jgi:hypothetical protein